MAKKFMLSTGRSTWKTEEYIMDLFGLYFKINPGDVPYLPDFGFNFTFAGIPKSELYSKMKFRLESFIQRLSDSFPGYRISLIDLKLVSEEVAKAVIEVNTEQTNIFVNIYEDR